MKIQSLIIENWKSIVHLELKNPNPFSVFVGPNASGKSNIFEALEFVNESSRISPQQALALYGGRSEVLNRKIESSPFNLNLFRFYFFAKFENFFSNLVIFFDQEINGSASEPEISMVNLGSYFENLLKQNPSPKAEWIRNLSDKDFIQFFKSLSKIFINEKNREKIELRDDKKLSSACGNLEKVLKRILQDENKREEILEWLQLLIPGLENIEIKSSQLSGDAELAIYEKGTKKPFPKSLISDGTYNILCLLTAVFQSNEPQFLLIEEPENGLNPKVVKEMVNLFRSKCEEEGHFIWLNTHSQTLIRQLREEEMILVDKKNGETIATQIKKGEASGLPMDEALLTNTLGGGIPW